MSRIRRGRTGGGAAAAMLALTTLTALALPGAIGSATASGAMAMTEQATPPQCTAPMTKVTFRVPPGGGAAGSTYGRMRITNTSKQTCTVRGYGGISYVGHGNGTQIGASSVRVPATVRTVTLKPGATTRAVLRTTDPGVYSRRECRPTKVDGFRVYIPNETQSKYVPHPTRGCANPAVKLLHNKPYR